MNKQLDIVRTLQREQGMNFGTRLLSRGVQFRLWAPLAKAVLLKLHDLDLVVEMTPKPHGWHEVDVPTAAPGMLYCFVLEDGTEVPDPASRFQPKDVDGPSEIIDPRAFPWTDADWHGRPWEETIFYELHVGTFTPEGTFRAITDKLDYLVDLGITAIELLPIADFPGQWNWGYDGVHLFAPDSSYGRPEDLKALINAAHNKGISVFLDVVYNHFGPKGNYMANYTPLMTEHHHTPWGMAVNYDTEGSDRVRDFVMTNARYWVNEYHFDGLRFDAIHEIRDDSSPHLLQAMAEQIRASAAGRHVHLIVENAKNQSRWLRRRDNGESWLFDAQWNDDVHHALHSTLTGETQWYYSDYADRLDLVGRSLAEGFAWQGEFNKNDGTNKGEPSAFLPPTAFVSFAQNHDQTGNRPFGERMTQLVEPDRARLWAAIYLLSPQIPMVFMGEEWGADEPFLFFTDVGDDLAEPIRKGRIEELKKFPTQEHLGLPPDPMSGDTFQAVKLGWDEIETGEHARFGALYRELIALRKREIAPRLAGMKGNSGRYEVLGQSAVRVSWTLGDGAELTMVANLSPDPADGVLVESANQLWLEGAATGETLEPWSVCFFLG